MFSVFFPLIEPRTQQISHPEPNFEKTDTVLTSKNVRELTKIRNSRSALLCRGIYYAVEVEVDLTFAFAD